MAALLSRDRLCFLFPSEPELEIEAPVCIDSGWVKPDSDAPWSEKSAVLTTSANLDGRRLTVLVGLEDAGIFGHVIATTSTRFSFLTISPVPERFLSGVEGRSNDR